MNLTFHSHSKACKYLHIIKLKLLTIDEIKCPVAPLHFSWDSSGSSPSSQETQFIVLQTWSVGQSLPTLHVLSRPFKSEKILIR